MKKILLAVLLFGVVFYGKSQVGYPYSEKVFNQHIDSLNKLRQKVYFNIEGISETVKKSSLYVLQLTSVTSKMSSAQAVEKVFWIDSLSKLNKKIDKNDSLFRKYKSDLQKSVEVYTRLVGILTNRYAGNPICENFFLGSFKKNITYDEETFNKYQKANMLLLDSYNPVFIRVKQTLSVLDAMKNIGK